jgi:hypothetical protein
MEERFPSGAPSSRTGRRMCRRDPHRSWQRPRPSLSDGLAGEIGSPSAALLLLSNTRPPSCTTAALWLFSACEAPITVVLTRAGDNEFKSDIRRKKFTDIQFRRWMA